MGLVHVYNRHSAQRQRFRVAAFVAAAVVPFASGQFTNAACYLTQADSNAAVQAAQPFIAKNGGPAVTVEVYDKSNGQVIGTWGSFSGHLETASWDAPGTASLVRAASHTFPSYYASGDTTTNRRVVVASNSVGVRVLTGSNIYNDRGETIEVTAVHVPANTNGTFDCYDVVGLELSRPVTNVGRFKTRLTPISPGESIVSVGNGIRLTVADANSSVIPPRDGAFSLWRALAGRPQDEPTFLNNYFNDFTEFGYGFPPPLNAVSTNGHSGAGSVLESSIAWGSTGKIQSLEFVGTNIGRTGQPRNGFGHSVYTASYVPEALSFAAYLDRGTWYYSTFTPGDANTDGAVNFSDLLTLAQNYGRASGAIWPDGDFNFDAAVNFTDLLSLAQNYGSGASVVTGAPDNFAADWQLAQSLVPEPSSLTLVVVSALSGRRRRPS